MRRHKIKTEKDPAPPKDSFDMSEWDLTYLIHDRVELLHQVFSVMRSREIKSMAPDCVKNVGMDDLKELCLEELLGISSKRLCAVLDGADPPSNTDSSSDEDGEVPETISLDSISSDEVIFNDGDSKDGKKKKKKHEKHRKKPKPEFKSKGKKKESKRDGGETSNTKKLTKIDEIDADNNARAAERAGMTVLELLELQARARAIRAQLALESQNREKAEAALKQIEAQKAALKNESDSEVEIKEEEPDVVNISSSSSDMEDQEPAPKNGLAAVSAAKTSLQKKKDLTVIVPKQNAPTRRVKLNRSKTVSVDDPNNGTAGPSEEPDKTNEARNNMSDKIIEIEASRKVTVVSHDKTDENATKKDKLRKKKRKSVRNYRKKSQDDGFDDEITLQLSDSEKMDLLDSFERRKSSSGESESGSESYNDSSDEIKEKVNEIEDESNKIKNISITIQNDTSSEEQNKSINNTLESKPVEKDVNKEIAKDPVLSPELPENGDEKNIPSENNEDKAKEKNIPAENNTAIDNNISPEITENEKENNLPAESNEGSGKDKLTYPENSDESSTQSLNKSNLTLKTNEKALINNTAVAVENKSQDDCEENIADKNLNLSENIEFNDKKVDENSETIINIDEKANDDDTEKITHDECREKSDGEVSDRMSSEVEMLEKSEEILEISDEEAETEAEKKKKSKKEKKKKEKKAKKEKKSKKSDFREGSDQNYFEDSDLEDLLEILEISDSDSDVIIEGYSGLSKEPTTEEIEDLSHIIDNEIEREEIVTEEQIRMSEQNAENLTISDDSQEVEPRSWKDRWLDSKKVKKVLATSNILNALRKKNIELKKKIEASKKNISELPKEIIENKVEDIVEGSIEQFNALEACTKYVDPIKEVRTEADNNDSNKITGNTDEDNAENEKTTIEMQHDAKQLLKMYKYLLKYNKLDKPKNKVKKKKKNKAANQNK